MNANARRLWLVLFSSSIAAAGPSGSAIDIHDTWLVSDPAISAKHIAFVYAGDLWTADINGNNVRRLTSDVGNATETGWRQIWRR